MMVGVKVGLGLKRITVSHLQELYAFYLGLTFKGGTHVRVLGFIGVVIPTTSNV